jgi:hypothetical protein
MPNFQSEVLNIVPSVSFQAPGFPGRLDHLTLDISMWGDPSVFEDMSVCGMLAPRIAY